MADILEIIKEEQNTPVLSSSDINAKFDIGEEPKDEGLKECENCTCNKHSTDLKDDSGKIEKLLRVQEEELKREYENQLEKDISILKNKFNFILQNEQVRASYMLREAHRERQEKVSALQTQLECKNLAGLMYVMCIERRKSKLEKLRLVEEYTNYIHALQDILTEAQDLILHLSRGYKTAARVNHEWRDKMSKIMKEFQAYVYHFSGGTPESNQYFFDLPTLFQTTTPLKDDPHEDPCELDDEVIDDASVKNKGDTWWERVEDDCPPFIMFGDMAEFKPPQRRQVLKTIKAAKTAPKKWKEYVFNEMFLKTECPNSDSIKDEYPKHLPVGSKWDCQVVQNQEIPSKMSLINRRATGQSVDIRGNMGSLLKIITSRATSQPVTKATLLGARDSMEIASTTKLREKHKNSEHSRVVLNVGNRRASLYDHLADVSYDDNEDFDELNNNDTKVNDEDIDESLSALGSVHNDSLQVIPGHVPDHDHKIHYEKVCPMEQCQRLQVNSFIKTLPPYMRASPFTHFEKTYEEYETCSPEQIEVLKQRIEDKKKKERANSEVRAESPLAEWSPSVDGVAIQTSAMSMSLPPCTCNAPSPTPVSSIGEVFRVDDLIPIKMALDRINRECLHDNRIDFNRFKLIGMQSNSSIRFETKADFQQTRLQEITKILNQHPSLLEIFQANTRC